MRSRMDVLFSIFACPSTGPAGSKRVKVKVSTSSSRGTPYCRVLEVSTAKQFRKSR